MHRDPTYMTILIADDDTDDRLFMDRALRESGYTQLVEFVEDGEELMGSDSKGVDAFKIVMPDKKLSRKLMEHVSFGEG